MSWHHPSVLLVHLKETLKVQKWRGLDLKRVSADMWHALLRLSSWRRSCAAWRPLPQTSQQPWARRWVSKAASLGVHVSTWYTAICWRDERRDTPSLQLQDRLL